MTVPAPRPWHTLARWAGTVGISQPLRSHVETLQEHFSDSHTQSCAPGHTWWGLLFSGSGRPGAQLPGQWDHTQGTLRLHLWGKQGTTLKRRSLFNRSYVTLSFSSCYFPVRGTLCPKLGEPLLALLVPRGEGKLRLVTAVAWLAHRLLSPESIAQSRQALSVG